MLELADMQRWMLTRILAGHLADASEVFVGRESCPAPRQLSIYAHGYRERLLECLRDDYPLLRALCGDTVFDLFARGYIAAHPSASFTLYTFGAGFAAHLEATCPPDLPAGAPEKVPAALASLERAMSESKRAAGPERQFAPLSPEILMLHPEQSLLRPDTVHLLRLAFDFTALIDAYREDRKPALPEAKPCLVAVARQNWHMGVHRLDALPFAFLEALHEPLPFGLAAEGAAQALTMEANDAITGLSAWLAFAAEAGLVTTER